MSNFRQQSSGTLGLLTACPTCSTGSATISTTSYASAFTACQSQPATPTICSPNAFDLYFNGSSVTSGGAAFVGGSNFWVIEDADGVIFSCEINNSGLVISTPTLCP